MRKTKKDTVTPLLRDTYFAIIQNSIETRMFRTFYAKVNGKKSDIMRRGDLSCALYVSAILKLFDLVERMHGTVKSTVQDMKKAGWKRVKVPARGDVIIWEAQKDKRGDFHTHIGFAFGNNRAISNSSKKGMPKEHHLTFGTIKNVPRRRIIAIYRRKL